ncbi:bacteriohemerythrin [Leptospira sp. 2 VSF19]|uniref:Bacteriohemerythrin n=1 Tax=Leptospira soteropolitanensis TaxID=2950025 RepID=A0AAW5VEF2_9LEPT|nr:bacteriohemerythrin [Leptospira soteropolitanensis]MCW7491915.1 bacteriohemerythrin [Leptospira soteropolitanensis]MCW7499499.1 bacteriohemerythrin [Leptospira soteropolitanensis]MCW7520910.1 bacteriohemerythrin [Leptospira soteropolitanensis]MCW7525603.1 bacteriohemerythrin [Leptospira soteropolitanensis]MCW7529469.1 bacteriohemerythrin [Leptospira soteropolitanensis]
MVTQWDSKYETNISEIDSQHKKLFRLINNIETVYDENKEHLSAKSKILVDAVSELEDYTLSHFLIEERVMELNQYPELEAHKKQHDRFTDKILELKNRLTTGNLLSNDEELNQFFGDLLKFLRAWLTNHILQEDMDYKPYIKFNI